MSTEKIYPSVFPDSEEIVFNPNEYTEKELLKLVYRELHRLREEFDEYRKNNTWQAQITAQDKRIAELEKDQLLQTKLREEAEKRHQRLITYITVGFTVLTLVLKFVLK